MLGAFIWLIAQAIGEQDQPPNYRNLVIIALILIALGAVAVFGERWLSNRDRQDQ